MIAALSLVSALAAAPVTKAVDIAFIPDVADLPPVVVRVVQEGSTRRIAWVIPGDAPASGALVDPKGPQRSLLPLPQAPAGASLHDDGGVLVVTIDNAGDWERRYAGAPPPSPRTRVAGVSVAGERALRLVVPALGAPPGAATLVGAKVRLSGRGVAMPAVVAPHAFVRVGADPVVVAVQAVDALPACGGAVPASFAADVPPLRLLGQGSASCAGPLAAQRVSGARLATRGDTPVAGVLLMAAP